MWWTLDDLGKREAWRYGAGQAVVHLGWWEGAEYRTCAAALENLSQGGALLRAAVQPPGEGSLWVRPAGTEPAEWAEAAAVESVRLPDGTFAVRVRFEGPCPLALFRQTVQEFGGGT